ncbi:MAG: hypothetical protein ABEJ61_10675 [Haloferacaceae archaeon]
MTDGTGSDGRDAGTRGTAGDGDEAHESSGGAGADAVGQSAPRVVGAWTAATTDCAACGAAVSRTWVEDGERVCGDCRSW